MKVLAVIGAFTVGLFIARIVPGALGMLCCLGVMMATGAVLAK